MQQLKVPPHQRLLLCPCPSLDPTFGFARVKTVGEITSPQEFDRSSGVGITTKSTGLMKRHALGKVSGRSDIIRAV